MPLIKREMGWIKIGEEDPPVWTPLIIAYKGEFYYEADYDPVGLKIDDVTHWRRLPHPPKD